MTLAPLGSGIKTINQCITLSNNTVTLHALGERFDETLQHSLITDFEEIQCSKNVIFATGIRMSLFVRWNCRKEALLTRDFRSTKNKDKQRGPEQIGHLRKYV